MACLLNRSPYEPARYNTEYPCHPYDCPRCGWNSEEHDRRIARGLTKGENGLKHFTKSKAVFFSDDTGN